ncbi:B3 domain-containing protein LFL1-like [Typha angustifolia]|uniref:B3 domain-containing protein LFL1-like n=1 Tax=Typha angustifolia TaxID=59011 RepID=UPI003C304917
MAGMSKSAASSSSSSSSSAAAGDLRVAAGFPASRKRRSSVRSRRHKPRETALDLSRPAPDPDQAVDGLRFILQKELRNSDVSALGRIVLPKKEAEAQLPGLTTRDGINITMHDLVNCQVWTFKYRYWPNNKSRMYILENTGDYVKAHGLQLGDFIMIYKDDNKDQFLIRAKKTTNEEATAASADDDGIFDSIVPDIVVGSARYSELFLPLADCMNTAYGLSFAFAADLCMNSPDDNLEEPPLCWSVSIDNL